MKQICHIILLILLLNLQQVFSQDTLKVKLLDDVIVFEKIKKNGDISRLPTIQGTEIFSGKKNEVISISSSTADLSTNNSRQLFGKVPGLSIWENDGSGIQTGIATRGLSPNRSWEFNVRQNGYDISSEVFGYPEAYYAPPTEALDRIEIVRGAGALQYGPQFGGLLNYITKKHLGNKPLSIESFQTIGSYGLINSFNAFGGKVKKFSYYAYLHHRSAEGWRKNSNYRTQTGSISLTYDISKKWQITGEYTRMNNKSQQSGGLSDAEFQIDARQSHRERNWFSTPWNSGALQVNFTPNENTRFNLRLFGVVAERNSVGFTRPVTIADTINTTIGSYNPRQIDRDTYRNFGAELRGIREYKFLKHKSALSGGVRAYTGQTIREQQGIGTTGLDYSMNVAAQQNGFDYGRSLTFETQNMAAFIENMFQITNKLAITPGVRYEFIRALASGYINTSSSGSINDQQRDRNVLLFGIGTEFTTSTTSNIYFNFSQGFRPVLFSELTPSATIDVIDPSIQDASGSNADLGFRGSLFQNILKFDVGVFRLFYDNRIGTISVDNAPFRTNIGASLSQGVESYVELDLMRLLFPSLKMNLSIFGNYAFVDARYTRWDNPALVNDPLLTIKGKRVENAPKHILRSGVTFKYKGFASTLQYNYVGNVFTDATNTVEPNVTSTTGQLPAYSLLDLNIAYQLKELYQFRAGVNNLTNTTYTTRRAGGYPGPGIIPGTGRTFYISIGFSL
jgi:Fe(3+) dicitrate transport protein